MQTSDSSSLYMTKKNELQFGMEEVKIRHRFCPNLAWRNLKNAMVKLRQVKQQIDAERCFTTAKAYAPYVCPLCGNYEQENFIEVKSEGDVICNGVDGEGCGLVMVERAIDHSPVPEYEGEEIRGHHGSANSKHISEASNLSTKLVRNPKSASYQDIKKVHRKVSEQFSTYGRGKENKDTRREYKEQQINQAASVFWEACMELSLSDRVQSIALDYFAAFRLLKKQIQDLGKWHAACLLLGLEEVNQFERQVVEVVATPPSKVKAAAPPSNQVKLAPPHKSRPRWNPPPPPSKRRKKSCLFHSSPKQVQRGDCVVNKERSKTDKRSSDYLDAMKKSGLDFRRHLRHVASPIVVALMNLEFGFVFGEPVDPVKLKLPDYFDVIKNPMDLGTVQLNLNELNYQSIEHFAADVRLVFNNCMTYNDPESELFPLAQGMLGKFEIMLAKASSSFPC
jgi:hypothetical protein